MQTSKSILAVPYVTVNDQTVYIIPNSVSFTEGQGEQSVKTQSAGGGNVTTIASDNAETKFSVLKFKLFASPQNINLALSWKKNRNTNLIQVTGVDPVTGGDLSRTFQNAMLTNDYEINLKESGDFDLEFHSDAAV